MGVSMIPNTVGGYSYQILSWRQGRLDSRPGTTTTYVGFGAIPYVGFQTHSEAQAGPEIGLEG